MASENTGGDGELGGESRPYRLSQRTSGDGSLGPLSLAHPFSTQASTWIDGIADIDKHIGQYARPRNLAKIVLQAFSRARLLQSGQPGRVLRPHLTAFHLRLNIEEVSSRERLIASNDRDLKNRVTSETASITLHANT